MLPLNMICDLVKGRREMCEEQSRQSMFLKNRSVGLYFAGLE